MTKTPTKKKRTPRRAPVQAPGKEWRKIIFGDLHVKSQTLTRCLVVLERIRELALKYDAEVVCKGDFWDQRGILSVRHMHAIQDELDKHAAAGIPWKLIPGNHDQVNRSGTIHGLRAFSGYASGIQVITEPLIDHDEQCAYLPWREDPEEQKRIFSEVPDGYTVFGHGEIAGAVANNGRKADGRFTTKDVAHLRAVFLSHYHKRHKVGANVWYTGSPFELDIGERNMPHGVGYVTSEKPEPYYFNLDELPKHWRFTWPQDDDLFSGPRENDIVEVLAPKHELVSPAFRAALAEIRAKDVRPLPLSQSTERGAPTFALSITEAVDRYVEEFEALPEGLSHDEARAMGHAVLSAVTDTGTIVPYGSVVHLKHVTIQDFCAIRGEQELPLDRLGTVLLRGRMGSGKTAITDAITWCLYGMTAPRKPGTAQSSIKADKIIHDEAREVAVSVELSLDDDPTLYRITRTKARSAGAKIDIYKDGMLWEEVGITDTQTIIHKVVGMDYDLWRTCVSLGQGEVQNFVTDAQKKRTELLERAFKLGACPHAQKDVRKKMSAVEVEQAPLLVKLSELRGRIKQAEEVDYKAETAAWERQRQSIIDESTATINAAKVEITKLDDSLVHEAAWDTRNVQLQRQRDRLHEQLAASKPKNMGHLHAKIGAATADLDHKQMALAAAKRDFGALQKGGAKMCPTCSQPIPQDQLETHLQESEERVRMAQVAVNTQTVAIQNLKNELGAAAEDKTDTSGISLQLKEVDEHVAAATKALNAIGQIKVKRQGLVTSWNACTARIDAEAAKVNPWKTKALELAQELEKLRDTAKTTMAALQLLNKRQALLKFWDVGFGAKGLPVLVLRTALYELEMYANRFLATIMQGRIYVELLMHETDLGIRFYEYNDEGDVKEREYENLSGGQRRCVQLAFAPFALGEMIFARTGVRIPFLVIDELTTHLDPETKPIVCDMIKSLGRDTVLVIDHDPQVQGSFDVVYDVERGGKIRRAG